MCDSGSRQWWKDEEVLLFAGEWLVAVVVLKLLGLPVKYGIIAALGVAAVAHLTGIGALLFVLPLLAATPIVALFADGIVPALRRIGIGILILLGLIALLEIWQALPEW